MWPLCTTDAENNVCDLGSCRAPSLLNALEVTGMTLGDGAGAKHLRKISSSDFTKQSPRHCKRNGVVTRYLEGKRGTTETENKPMGCACRPRFVISDSMRFATEELNPGWKMLSNSEGLGVTERNTQMGLKRQAVGRAIIVCVEENANVVMRS